MNTLLRRYSLSALLLGLTLGPVTLDAQDRDLRAERIVVDDDAADGGMNTLTLDPANLPTDQVLTIPAPNGPGGSFLISNPTGAGGQTMSGPLSIDELRLMSATTAFYSSFLSPSGMAGSLLYTLPAVQGGVNSVLTNNGSGVLSWAAPVSTDWSLTGNAATVPGTNFLGTTDNQAFEIHIFETDAASKGSKRVWRAEPNAASANIIGGYQGNTVTANVVGATIGGGGNSVDANSVTDEYGTVGGGARNRAGNAAGSTADAGYATVAGGRYNTAVYAATVAGGWGNNANANGSSIGGGYGNTISPSGSESSIIGGEGLTLNGSKSFGYNGGNSYPGNAIISATNVGYFGNVDLWLGNTNNTARALRFYEAQATTGAFPAAGTNFTSFAAGAQSVDIIYTLPTAAPTANGQVLASTTGGAMSWVTDAGLTQFTESYDAVNNIAGLTPSNAGVNVGVMLATKGTGALQADATDGAASGGNARGDNAVDWQQDRLGSANVASGDYAVIGGGTSNTAAGTNATVAGGRVNTASAFDATIGGGGANQALGLGSTIGGGFGNVTNSDHAVVSGGVGNSATGYISAIIGGRQLTLSGAGSFGYLSSMGTSPMTVADNFTGVFGNTNLWLANNTNTASQLRFYEANNTTGAFPPAGTNYTAFAAGAQTADITYTLPTAITGTIGDTRFLRSTTTTANTASTLDWVDLKTAVDGLGSIDLSNSSATTPTLTLANSDASGTALEITAGRVILSYAAVASGATITNDVAVVNVGDEGTAATRSTVTLPATGANGQIIVVTTDDPDGVDVDAGFITTSDNLTALRFVWAGGSWRREF